MSTKLKNKSLISKFYTNIVHKLYGLGASVVIIGAMFKLLNLSGASVMLAIGLTTEAIIFFLSAFEPKEKEYDWTKVYPELKDDEDMNALEFSKEDMLSGQKNLKKRPTEAMQGLDKVLTDFGLNEDVLMDLKDSVSKIASFSQDLGSISDVYKYSKQYCDNISKASNELSAISNITTGIGSSIEGISVMAKSNNEINQKMGDILSTLSTLNDTYKNELTDISNRMASSTHFSDSIKNVATDMENLESGVKQFKLELLELNKKFQSLNSIYGNMLNSFKS